MLLLNYFNQLPFLLSIKDVFSIAGCGTVVDGRVEQGTIRKEIKNIGHKIKLKASVKGNRGLSL